MNFCVCLNLDQDQLFSNNPESGLASLNPDLYSIKRVRIRTETPKTDSDMSWAKDFVAINAFNGAFVHLVRLRFYLDSKV